MRTKFLKYLILSTVLLTSCGKDTEENQIDAQIEQIREEIATATPVDMRCWKFSKKMLPSGPKEAELWEITIEPRKCR